MTIDPQVLRAEQHVEIGRVLHSHASALIDLWSRRAAQEQPHADRGHQKVLRDRLMDFLQALGRSLAESVTAESAPHRGFAAEHGEQRWEAGWSLPEVVRDYQILRLVLFEHLEETLQRPLVQHEAQAIGLALDEAIASSVAAYVRHRDAAFHRLEQDLRNQAEQLREVDRRKNEFLAILAHELRNPMAPILHSIEALKLRGRQDAIVLQAHDIIERQVRQMVRLVDDLLDLTRIAQGKIQLQRTQFEAATVVAEAIQTTTPVLEAQGHQLSVSLPTEPLRLE
ncbi:MAG TPA: histidine kinase dimerization/phospho-acceptor domain-containing protein, partial [Gemmataceae bacterium]|nr:histidine kinase dimerization/phospho-acceptor domain-containing protein [Gemmataceae bacterium]